MSKAQEKAAPTAETEERPKTTRQWTQFDSTGITRLYVATPTVIFKTPGYFKYVEACVRRMFPDIELVFGAREFSGTKDWLARWDEVLASVDGLVFASDPDSWIGMGVYKEIQDAQAAGLRVGYHVNSALFCTLDDVVITVVEPDNKVRYAKVKHLR